MLVSTIDFRYISDAVTQAEALQILKDAQADKQKRIDELINVGYPCYTTQVGACIVTINIYKTATVTKTVKLI